MLMVNHRSEEGVAVVELAIVVPLLVLMLFGVIEASSAIAKQNEVRDVARQAARLAATDPAFNSQDISTRVLDDSLDGACVVITASDPSLPFATRALAFATVKYVNPSPTGFIPVFDDAQMQSRVQFRVESPVQPAWWPDGGASPTCPY